MDRSKCLHKRVAIGNEELSYSVLVYQDNEVVDGGHTHSKDKKKRETGRFMVHCDDCDFYRIYKRSTQSWPVWVGLFLEKYDNN